MALLDDLCKRYDRLIDMRRLWEPVWQELADYILPRKGGITTRVSQGQKLTTKLFDSTAVLANELLAASLQGALTSDAFKWFRLKTRRQDLNDIKVVAEFLDEAADRMFLAFRQSNLNSELQEVYLDLGAFGTGALYLEEIDPATPEFSGFRFHYIQLDHYVISENKDGLVDTVCRTIRMPARAAFALWKKKIGDALFRKYEKEPDELVSIVHCVYPRTDIKKFRVAKTNKPFASVYFSRNPKHMIQEGGFDYFPMMVPRWTKMHGEVYGRGPGFIAIPDVRTLNKAVELTLKAWAKAIDPPLKVRDDGVIGRVKQGPSDLITLRDLDAVRPLESGARFDVNQVQADRLRIAIKDAFFNNQLQLPNGQVMTATEVERRFELMQRFLGPTLGRIQTELLNPLIQRSFGIMFRRGAMPDLPSQLFVQLPDGSVSMETIDIEYEGPLARAQRASDVQAIERTIQDLSALVGFDPTVLDIVDLDVVARMLAERNGVPPQAVRDAKTVRQIRDARRQAQEQAQQIQQLGETASKVAPLLRAVAPKGIDSAALQQAAP